MNLVLVGYMGSGKTSVGRRVAQRLGYGYLDTDHFIEQEMGCSISQLFDEKGETFFRQIESRIAAQLHKLDNHVIATGGGILTRDGNLEALTQAGVTIFLNADPEDIYDRLQRDTRRPKLREGDLQETVTRMLEERMERYRQCSIIIDTKGKSVNRVAGKVIEEVAGFSTRTAQAGPDSEGEPREHGSSVTQDGDEAELESGMQSAPPPGTEETLES